MDKCPKCGNKLSSIDVLCPKCGALVEVVQIKKGVAGQNASSGLGIPLKKLPQQNLILYNDDWPTDDAEPIPEEITTVKPVNTPAYSEPDEVSELLRQLESPALPDTKLFSPDKAYPPEAELGSEENYLAMFRNMKLPELEDINTDIIGQSEKTENFAYAGRPEYTVQSDDSPEQSELQAAEPIHAAAEPAQHRWLEIEELPDNVSADTSPATTAEMPVSDAVASEAESISDDIASESVPAPAAVPSDETPRFRYRTERRQATTVLHPRRSAGRAVMMIFVWLLVTAALFCGFFFLDQYVTENYGTYQAMLYEWSGGNIDLAPSEASSPTPLEASAP